MKDKSIKDAMSSIENRIRHVYNQGYEDGIKDGKASVQIKRFSASEAMAKIKEYEEKQKRTCDTCKYGGHTLQDLKKCVYCDGSYYWTPKKMTLDEAIKHCEEVSEEQERLCKCNDDYNFSQPKWRKCAEEHRQLAEWLKELKELKEEERREG